MWKIVPRSFRLRSGVRARIDHVSVGARDLTESVRFYTELFGAEKIETPNFGYPVQWLRVGDLQIHLFQRSAAAPTYHHFGLEVDDFDTAFRETRARGMHDRETMGAHLNELPSGQVQLYVRDPGGNLVEINCADVRALSPEIRSELVTLRDRYPQDADNARASLDLKWSSSEPSGTIAMKSPTWRRQASKRSR
jgi:catechol 2,3-dioxygenase-like lactoylglutathione lyase family enzyme